MVWVRMGLLDDAIREHLELKRQRGADPGEVAREQREALDAPVQGTSAEDRPLAADVASAAPLVDPPAPSQPDLDPGGDVVEESSSLQPSVQASDTAVGGETAELDMSSVLCEDADAVADHASSGGPADNPDAVAADPALTQEDSLEWEMPGEAPTADAEAEETAEDVLEETPEFLRDTPEQERLWFEQRPPRDFDFDK
jgi:hypothetical protein